MQGPLVQTAASSGVKPDLGLDPGVGGEGGKGTVIYGLSIGMCRGIGYGF